MTLESDMEKNIREYAEKHREEITETALNNCLEVSKVVLRNGIETSLPDAGFGEESFMIFWSGSHLEIEAFNDGHVEAFARNEVGELWGAEGSVSEVSNALVERVWNNSRGSN